MQADGRQRHEGGADRESERATVGPNDEAEAGHNLGDCANVGILFKPMRSRGARQVPGSAQERGDKLVGTSTYTGIIEREGDLYVALCPELDVASQGATVEEATANLREAVELFLESASPEEIKQRLHTDVFVTRFEAAHG